MRCNAKTRSGEQCKAGAVIGKTKCRMHGGKSLAGAASPTYKTGKYSKYLPARLSGQYEASKSDPALLELREDIALIDTRLSDLIKRVDTGESGHLWRNIATSYRELETSIRDKDSKAMMEAMRVLSNLITKGAADYRAWDEVHTVIEQRRRLVESERKRLIESRTVLSIDQAMLMISALTDIINTHVTDRKTLTAITADVAKLIVVESN